MGQVVVASRLADGRSVFLAGIDAGTARWSELIAEAAEAEHSAEAERLLAAGKAAEAANEVVDPYLIDVAGSGTGRRPMVWREAIRAEGPTVRTDLDPEAALQVARRAVTGRTAARSGRRLGK